MFNNQVVRGIITTCPEAASRDTLSTRRQAFEWRREGSDRGWGRGEGGNQRNRHQRGCAVCENNGRSVQRCSDPISAGTEPALHGRLAQSLWEATLAVLSCQPSPQAFLPAGYSAWELGRFVKPQIYKSNFFSLNVYSSYQCSYKYSLQFVVLWLDKCKKQILTLNSSQGYFFNFNCHKNLSFKYKYRKASDT